MDDISQYFGYVEYLVKKKYNHLNYPTVSLDDLVQEGKVGLIEAAQRYDKSMDVPFLSFAKLRIEGAIRDCLRRADSLSQADRAKLKSLQTAKDRLEQEWGREVEIGELAEHMDLSDEAVDEISQFANTSQSLDNWQAEGGEEGFDVLVDPGQETDLVMRDVADCLSSVLSQQDRQIFILRVHTGLPLRAVGKMVDISAPETVRRIVQKATERMKGCLTEKGWGAHEE